MSTDSNIKVVCRIRAENKNELNDDLFIVHNKSSLVVNTSNEINESSPTFEYDYCADQLTTQNEIFENVGYSLTQNCIEGYNATVMCYGQTGIYSFHISI